MSLGIGAAYLVGAFGAIFLFVVLGERRFGIQISTTITYTYFAFWYIFFPTRGLLEKYSLRNKRVQQRIPHLFMIHCAVLILMFLGQTVWFAMKAGLPGFWLTELGKRDGTPLMIVFFVAVFFTQVLISRRILSRSLRMGPNESGSDGVLQGKN
jgi:hypothetical protein